MAHIFEWSKIETNKTSGITKVKCPECTPTRKNKSDRSLYVSFGSGVAKCFNCEALSFRDSVEKETLKKDYKIPEQTWRNYTNISDVFIHALEKRKIRQSTIIHFAVTEEEYYQPALHRKCQNLVFNFFEGEMVVNKKYRGANKSFTQSKDTKSIFYNINAAIGQNEVYIVEGEFDVLALYEVGIKNAISVPNGANDNDAYWINSEKYLHDVKKFYIAVDNDEKGNDLAEKIAQRLGRWKCERVNFIGKDANDDLISGCLEETAYKTTKYPVAGTHKVFDLYDEILALHDNGMPETISPKHRSFGKLKEVFSVMRGHLITGTGIPSHGKSNFTEWYVLNLVNDYDMKASFFSPEHHPFALHQTTFIEKTFGKNFFYENPGLPRIDKTEIARYAEWANEKIYLTGTENGEFPTWGWLFEKFKEQLFSYGIDIFVIDAFNKLSFDGKGNKLDQINEVLTKLTMFAQMNNVIIFLVAHPTKMQKEQSGLYASPTLYDVSGSSDFRNQTHDGFSIYRHFGSDEDDPKTVFTNLKTKMKFQGTINGSVEYDYHIPSGRYFELGTQYENYSLLQSKPDETELPETKELPKMMPTDEIFGDPNNDELIPF